jgi:hypothetical protein
MTAARGTDTAVAKSLAAAQELATPQPGLQWLRGVHAPSNRDDIAGPCSLCAPTTKVTELPAVHCGQSRTQITTEAPPHHAQQLV